ncbi:MAG TPA: zf-HC2 domain-containing protein, partial [Polyangiaceae bacterium]
MEARNLLLDRRRGTLAGEARAEVDRHLATCEACRQEDAADRELSAVLEQRLPKRTAPAGLRSAIEARVTVPTRKRPAVLWRIVPAAVVAGALGFAAATALFVTRAPSPAPMFEEAVNDHLRVLYSTHPVDIESGGVHQVKPWFEGRLDFAPVVGFGGDDEFPLQGGAVAYFLDRQAAVFVYKRNLHVITLFVFRA